MIYVTGDIHGEDTIRKLGVRRWPEGAGLTRDDYVIILGDFGLVWSSPESDEDRWWLDWLESKPWTTLFVDGNHENHDLLGAMPDVPWMGGRVHEVRPHVLHLMRGEVFALGHEGELVTVFVMGGARSHDVEWRNEGVTWWARELPDAHDFDNGADNLQANGWGVDYVLTHDCPKACKPSVLRPPSMYDSGDDPGRWAGDRLTGYLDRVDAMVTYRLWYFGHYHVDRTCADGRHVCLYDKIVKLGETV